MAHITRFEAPWYLRISKKEYKWTVRASPGPHPIDKSIPLLVLIRDYLNIASTAREAKRIIFDGKVMVDGRVRKDYKYPVGLMDVVSIPSADIYIRIIPDNVRYLKPVEISKEESGFKYARVLNKTTIKDGNIQLNLEDGRNILINKEKLKEFNPPTLTTLKISIPDQQVLDSFDIKEGAYAIIIGGKNVGMHGVITKIQLSAYKKRKYSIVTIQDKEGKIYQTNLENIFAIGHDKTPDMRLLL